MTRSLSLGYLRLAVAALLVSGVFVLLVAVARTPLVELVVGRGYIHVALVAHVIFALDVWLLAFAALLWLLAAERRQSSSRGPVSPLFLGEGGADGVAGRPSHLRTARLGLLLGSLGAALLAGVPLAGLGQPVMADYVPILLHPAFVLGLGLFFGGIASAAVGFLSSVRWLRPAPPVEVQALGMGALAYLAGLASVGLAALRWGVADHATLVWGAGHLFQVVNASALLALWLGAVPAVGPRGRALLRLSLPGFGLAIALALLVPVSAIHWEAVAPLFWAATGAPLVVAWLVVVEVLVRRGLEAIPRRDRPFLLFSLALLAMGGLIALPGMGNDTRVTAHYHAVVGAVTTMYMGFTYRLLWRLGVGVTWRGMARLQPHLYGYGLFALVSGLFLAGEAGTTRKTFEAIARGELTPAGALFVLGALATVGGGIAFVASAGRSLLSEASFTTARPVPAPPVHPSAPAPLASRR